MKKLQEKYKADAAQKVAGKTSLEDIAEVFGSSVESRDGVAFASMGASNLEPALLGAVASASENVISGPVAGQMGVYMFKVNSREEGSFYTQEDAENLANQKAQYNSQMILPAMMELADVKDNRARFF